MANGIKFLNNQSDHFGGNAFDANDKGIISKALETVGKGSNCTLTATSAYGPQYTIMHAGSIVTNPAKYNY